MDNYFTSYRLFFCLPTLELTIFEVCTYIIIGEKQLQKKERDHIEQHSAYQAKMLYSLRGW